MGAASSILPSYHDHLISSSTLPSYHDHLISSMHPYSIDRSTGSLPASEYSSVGIVEVLRSTPTLERVLAGNVQRFLISPSGKDALQSMHSIADDVDASSAAIDG